MTVNEKAKELVDKFHYQICNDCGLSESDSTEFAAKQCALIAVEYLIEETYYEIYNDERKPLSHRAFWKQVKTEIKNL